MKEIIAISVASLNSIDTFEKDFFEDYSTIIFSSKIDNKHKIIEECASLSKSLLILDIEDVDISFEEIELEAPSDTQRYINKLFGTNDRNLILPNKEDIRRLHDFIKSNYDNNFIVGCTAGISRTGALVSFLESKGWMLNKNYNNKFLPNELILNMLKEIDNNVN